MITRRIYDQRIERFAALKEGRIDMGFGRLRHSDPGVNGTVLREERLAVALPRGSALAAETGPLPLAALGGQRLIVYPKGPRPSFADYVLRLLRDADPGPVEVHEVREIQTALGLVAAETGICIIPCSAQQMRSDVTGRRLADPQAVSPVILSHRASDSSAHLALVRRLLDDIYAEKPPWLEPD